MKHLQPCYKYIDKVIFRALKMVPCILSQALYVFPCVSYCFLNLLIIPFGLFTLLRLLDDVPIDTRFFACNMSSLKSQVHSSSYLLVCSDQKLAEANNA